MNRTNAATLVALVVTVAACASAAIPPARTGTDLRPIDEPCNPANGLLEEPTQMMSFEPLEFPVPARWVPDFQNLNNLDFNLQRTGTSFNVWKGSKFVFAPVLPLNTAECEISRGDTTIKIRTTMIPQGITNYRVDVSWQRQIGGQYVYMQLQTRFPEHLRQIRGVIDGVRYPVRAASAR